MTPQNEIWNLIRINPEELPTGEIDIVPSFEYTRMGHKKLRGYRADVSLVQGDSLSTYSLTYPELQRELKISFQSKFPYEIERWEETHSNGLKTTAERMQSIQSAYWGQNSNQDLYLRDQLGL